MTGARKVVSKPGLPQAAQLLLAIRHQRGWTQRQLADALDTSRGALSDWERGKTKPPIYLLSRIKTLAGAA